MESMIRQIMEYEKQFGLRKTIKHCYVKFAKVEEKKYYDFRMKNKNEIKQLRYHDGMFEREPRISIVVPLYKTPKRYLSALIHSLQNQIYPHWELCLSDGSGEKTQISQIVLEYSVKDSRIKFISSEIQLNISDNTNLAATLVTGEYIVFMDHDDIISPDALFYFVKKVNECPEVELLYTDEDKISEDGKTVFQPHFKSDYNRELLMSMNYICHMVMVKTSLFKDLGGLRNNYDGAQDYDFLLRCIDETQQICHIPRILYHWRVADNSTAGDMKRKDYATDAGRRALEDYITRNKIGGTVVETENPGIYRIQYEVTDNPLVSVIIPNKDHVNDLKKCLQSVIKKSGYKNYEILIIENNSTKEDTFKFYTAIERKYPNIRVLYWDGEFDFSSIINFGASNAKGEYLLLLNNDIEIISHNFMYEMLGVNQQKNTAVVGSLLYYPNNIIQHAGVIVGYSGIAGHAFIGESRGMKGYFSRIICRQNYSAVTGACMMIKRMDFDRVGGFDEKFKIAFNDVDFCLRLCQIGKEIVFDPWTEAYHYESKSRGSDQKGENAARFAKEIKLFKERWNDYIKKGDPYYSINLTLERPDFSLKIWK